MSAIKTWSTTAAGNNAAAPDGFPENMAPSGVNNAAREVMAQVATWYRDAEWRDLGHGVANASASSFTVAGVDATADYVPGRRLRLQDSATLYGTVTASSFATDTTVEVALDSGAISAALSAVALGPLAGSLPQRHTARPLLLATLNVDADNVTGDGTEATVPFDTVLVDQRGEFAANTYTATVPGWYEIKTAVRLQGLTGSHVSCLLRIKTSLRIYVKNCGNIGASRSDANSITVEHGCAAFLDAGDTVTISVQIGGAASSTVDLGGDATDVQSFISTSLIA